MKVVERSYTSGSSDLPLLGRTIGEDLRRAAARQPEHEALVDIPAGDRWTYRQLDETVDRVATAILRLDIDKGDRVGIWSPNCAEWVFIQYATAQDWRSPGEHQPCVPEP